MNHLIRKIAILIVSLMVISLSIGGVLKFVRKSNDATENYNETTQLIPDTEESVTVSESTEEEDTTTQEQVDQDEEAFRKAKIKQRMAGYVEGANVCRLPDGTELECMYVEEPSDQYAIFDIDGDGKEELLICHTDASSAGMTELIYDYDVDTDTMRLQGSGYPNLTFYSNFAMEVPWSHNQGLGQTLWPYTLYRYDSANDNYVVVGSVDTWEKSYFPEDYDGNPFPDEKDVDSDGVLYYLSDTEGNDYDVVKNSSDYEAWRNAVVGDATELEIPWEKLESDCTQGWVTPYITMLAERIDRQKTTETDLGVIYMQSTEAEYEEYVSVDNELIEKYNVELTDSGNPDVICQTGTLNGKEVYYSTDEDGGQFYCYGEPVENVSVLGVQVGMSKKEAVKCLKERGFCKNSYGKYVTGDAGWNYQALIEFKKGIVTQIGMRHYSSYSG